MTEVSAGRVGRAHGRDGSFYVDRPAHPLGEGTVVQVGGSARRIERRGGMDDRPLLKLEGVDDRDAAGAIRGEFLLIDAEESPLEEGEYIVSDLVGCKIEGIGYVERVLDGPSCDVLEVGEDAVLVPLVSDAVKRIDLEQRIIEVDREFLGL
ncbi:MAG: rRNA processing protein RimM [Thermoleophilaceae bacterium]|nr:rRNA processing protein RimM [Thermoleophilaceae bacterium]